MFRSSSTYIRRVDGRCGPTADQLGPGGQTHNSRECQVTHLQVESSEDLDSIQIKSVFEVDETLLIILKKVSIKT